MAAVYRDVRLSSSYGIGPPEYMIEGRALVGCDAFHKCLDRGDLCFGLGPLSLGDAGQGIPMGKTQTSSNKVERHVLRLPRRPGIALRQKFQRFELVVVCHDPCPSWIRLGARC